MVRTSSTMLLPLGTKAPAFQLPDPSGKFHGTADATDTTALLVMFICNHCPYVRLISAELAAFGRDYAPKGVAIFAVNSNNAEAYPDDSPEMMRTEIRETGYTFPYLIDENQEVAKAYHAACTPDFFLFNGEQKLVYRGQFDDARPSNGIPPTGKDLRAALDAVLSGTPLPTSQRPSLGCNIKWRPKNEQQ